MFNPIGVAHGQPLTKQTSSKIQEHLVDFDMTKIVEQQQQEALQKYIMQEATKIAEAKINTEVAKISAEYEGWTVATGKKHKRNSPTDETRRTRQKLLTEYKVNEVNKFQLLASEDDATPTERKEKEEKIKVAPIMISGVHEYQIMVNHLNNIAKNKYMYLESKWNKYKNNACR